MAIDPVTLKIIAQAAVKVATDEETRQKIIAISLVPIIAVLLILCIFIYILSSPMNFLSDSFGVTGDQKTAIESYKSQYEYITALPIGSFVVESKYAKPVNGELITKYGQGNDGITYKATIGSVVYGIANGGQVVTFGSTEGGKYILIKYTAPDEVFYAYYWNLLSVNVLQDQEVKQGSIIGKSSDTLYFEVRSGESAILHKSPEGYVYNEGEKSSE